MGIFRIRSACRVNGEEGAFVMIFTVEAELLQQILILS